MKKERGRKLFSISENWSSKLTEGNDREAAVDNTRTPVCHFT
jgi:hypothetical protein